MRRLLWLACIVSFGFGIYSLLFQHHAPRFSDCEKKGGTPVFVENTEFGWECKFN